MKKTSLAIVSAVFLTGQLHDFKTYQVTCSTKNGAQFAVVTYFEIHGQLESKAAVRQAPAATFAEALVVRDLGALYLLYDPESSDGRYRKSIVINGDRSEYRELPNGRAVELSCSIPREIGNEAPSA